MNLNSFTEAFSSFWKIKPIWCQPWSIILTGTLFIFLSWQLFENIYITSLLCIIIFSWWFLFLLVAPILYLDSSNSSGISNKL
tara:strand:+ start:294 stop:542 length:249 start_codon:yes stop_codon:yes gene_type:complete